MHGRFVYILNPGIPVSGGPPASSSKYWLDWETVLHKRRFAAL